MLKTLKKYREEIGVREFAQDGKKITLEELRQMLSSGGSEIADKFTIRGHITAMGVTRNIMEGEFTFHWDVNGFMFCSVPTTEYFTLQLNWLIKEYGDLNTTVWLSLGGWIDVNINIQREDLPYTCLHLVFAPKTAEVRDEVLEGTHNE